MTSVKSLRNARQSYSVALNDYLNSKRKTDFIHIFLENQADPSYYLHHISGFIADLSLCKIYRCKNKENVEKAAKTLASGVGIGKNVLLFVDRDYDDYINHSKVSGVYYTDYYSIESELDSQDVLFKIWHSFFHNLPSSEKPLDFVSRWERLKRQFVHRLAQVLFPIIIQYRKGNLRGNLDKLTIKPSFYIDSNGNGRIKRGMGLKILKNALPLCIANNLHLTKAVRETRKSIVPQNPLSYIRGKQVYELLLLFLRSECLKLQAKYTSSPKFKCDLEFHASTPLSFFTPLTSIPLSLSGYLISKIKKCCIMKLANSYKRGTRIASFNRCSFCEHAGEENALTAVFLLYRLKKFFSWRNLGLLLHFNF